MMDKSYAYAETLDVLDNMEDIYVKQIPIRFLETLRENASNNYIKHISKDIDLKEQKIHRDTMSILALINLKYWVKNGEHKDRLIRTYKENDKNLKMNSNAEIQLNEIFAKQRDQKIIKDEKSIEDEKMSDDKQLITVKKDNFIARIIKKIKILISK